MKKHIYYTAIFIMAFTGCDDYLDVEPKGLVIPKTIEDFDLLLNGGGYNIHTTTDGNTLFLTADDFVAEKQNVELGNLNDPSSKISKLYRWATDLFDGMSNESVWNLPYANIYTYNLIINSIDTATFAEGYKEEDKNIIKAEAKIGRAYEYWLLVNTFAKQYSESSASRDLGVPLVLTADLTIDVPNRSSVKEVCDFIIKETEESIPHLPEVAKNMVRPSKAAGYGLLARFYLSINNYKKALTNASSAIEEKGELWNYNIYLDFALKSEQYISRFYIQTKGFDAGRLSDDLLDLFSPDDARLQQVSNCNWTLLVTDEWEYVCGDFYRNNFSNNVSHAVSIPEMYLIRAECNARLTNGSIDDVLTDLNALRAKRLPNYVDLTVADITNKEEALTFVLEERRRELFMKGMRLFDIKRLNLNPKTAKTVVHTIDGVDYTLAPNADNWVLPIPSKILNFSPNMSPNPRD